MEKIKKTLVFRFSLNENILKTNLFRKRRRYDIHVISLTEFSAHTTAKWPMIIEFLNFPSAV